MAMLDEYMIGLGYTVDQQGQAKFTAAIAGAANRVQALATALAGMSIQAARAVAEMAREFENLYYTSQRTTESVSNLQAFAFGARQIGVSAGSATAAIENMQKALRVSPGTVGVLRNLGVGPQGTPVEQFEALIRALRKMPYYQGVQFAELFGMDERTFQMVSMNLDLLREKSADFVKRQKDAGVDTGKLAEESTRFERAWETLKSDVEILGQKIQEFLLPIMETLVGLADRFVRLINNSRDTYNDPANKISRYAYGYAYKLGMISKEELDAEIKRQNALPEDLPSRGGQGGSTLFSGRGKAGEIMDFFTKAGLSPQAAAGIAANAERESGMRPDATGDGGAAYGLFQWHPDRQAQFQKLYGKSMVGSSLQEQMQFALWEMAHGSGRERDTMRLLQGPAGQSANEAAITFARVFERHGMGLPEDIERGRLGERILMNQTNNIHVSGASGDAVASAVTGAMNRVNGDFVRNLGGAVK